MLPVLRCAQHGEIVIGKVVEDLADEFCLSDEQRSALLPSGKQTTFANRVHWAKSYLGKAKLVELTRRGHFRITDRGKEVLQHQPERIDIRYLTRFPEFEQFRSLVSVSPQQAGATVTTTEDQLSPDERIRQLKETIDADLANELLERVQGASPAFFESVVIQLLLAMGYGGSEVAAGRALGKSGDGGVDGVIDEDALGLDRIYVQAKRYQEGNLVGPGAIREFFGALDQFKANKGLFVTTSGFTNAAKDTAASASKRIVLIDGLRLGQLLVRYGVGCRTDETIVIKRIDQDFFG